MPITNPNTGGSRIPQGAALPKPFKFEKTVGTDTKLVLKKDTNAISHFDETGITLDDGTVRLGNHCIGSSAESITALNKRSNIAYSPCWQGISSNGQTVIKPSVFDYEPLQTEESNGKTSTGSLPFDYEFTFTESRCYLKFDCVPSETVTSDQYPKISLYSEDSLVYQSPITEPVRSNERLQIQLSHPLYVRAGTFRIVISYTDTETGLSQTLMAVNGLIDESQPYRMTQYRPFDDSLIWHDSDSERVGELLGLPDMQADIDNRVERGWNNTPEDWRVAILGSNEKISYALNVDLAEVSTLNGISGNVQNQFDAQSELLTNQQSQLNQHDSKINSNISDITTLENKTNDHDSEISGLTNRTDTLETEMDKRVVRSWVNTPDEWKVAIVGSNDTISYSLAASLTELGYLSGLESNVQNQINNLENAVDNKQAKSWNNVPNELMVALLDSNGRLTYSAIINSTELGCLNNCSSNIQNQINGLSTDLDNKVTNSTYAPLSIEAVPEGDGTDLQTDKPNLYLKGQCYVSGSGSFRSSYEKSLGSSSQRWDTVYYNTLNVGSDERIKTVHEYPVELLDVWFEHVKPKCFSYNDKPDTKRFGVIAQDVISAFEAAGLDWTDYRVVLVDDSEDVDPSDIQYYGVDYIQIQSIEMAAMRRRIGV